MTKRRGAARIMLGRTASYEMPGVPSPASDFGYRGNNVRVSQPFTPLPKLFSCRAGFVLWEAQQYPRLAREISSRPRRASLKFRVHGRLLPEYKGKLSIGHDIAMPTRDHLDQKPILLD